MTNIQDTAVESATDPTAEPAAKGSSRRAALRALAVGGGAAAGVMAFGKSASAADGDPLELGEAIDNNAQTPTSLVYDGAEIESGPSVLSVGDAVPADDAPFPANVGGYGNDLVANGLHGSTTNPAGFGVVAANLGELADPADAAPAGLAVASAAGAQILFAPLDGAVVGPTEGTHVAGELYRDAEGTLWFTVPAGGGEPDAVRFVKLAGTPASGSFHAIDPQRAYDSRNEGFSPGGGPLAPNSNRVISITDGHDGGGIVTLAEAVPAGATAVQINLTAANPTGPNFLSVTSADVEATFTSVLNWGPDELQIANSITVPVNADGEIRVYCGDQAGSTHFIVDVFGYYL